LNRSFALALLHTVKEEENSLFLRERVEVRWNQKGCAFKIPFILTPWTLLRAGFSLKGE
jgi:hypothetical protein